jgi:hypothetical protein
MNSHITSTSKQLKYILSIGILSLFCSGLTFHKNDQRYQRRSNIKMEIFEGNPIGKKIWDAVWTLPIMRPGQPGTSPTKYN